MLELVKNSLKQGNIRTTNINIEGRKIICENITVILVFGDITPIRTDMVVEANAAKKKTGMKLSQFAGIGALKTKAVKMEIMPVTIAICTIVEMIGISRIDRDGMPLIL